MSHDTIDHLLQAYRDRDIWLFFGLFVIGTLYYLADNALAEFNDYLRENPGARAMYEAWKRARPVKVMGKAYCSKHQSVVDHCKRLHDDDK
jgi:hypothetical protein